MRNHRVIDFYAIEIIALEQVFNMYTITKYISISSLIRYREQYQEEAHGTIVINDFSY